jgi:hypothetical protein
MDVRHIDTLPTTCSLLQEEDLSLSTRSYKTLQQVTQHLSNYYDTLHIQD